MPEKIVLEDGTEKEILTDEEVNNLKAGHDANLKKRPIVEQYNKIAEELELKEGEKVEEKIKELKESANPNWQKMRAAFKALKKAAKEKNIEIDENGNVVEKEEDILTKEDAEEIARKTLIKTQTEQRKEKILSKFNEKDAETISKVFDKLNELGGDFDENIKLAIEKVLPGESENLLKSAVNNLGGGTPKVSDKGNISSDIKSFGVEKLGLSEKDFDNIK